ncbi:MAG: sensor histidine kinase, partial [Bacteroidia bacterium]|nr:sensor histidine kinase [Bacteroidia bacterium]
MKCKNDNGQVLKNTMAILISILSVFQLVSCSKNKPLSPTQKSIVYLNNQSFNERLYDSKLSLKYADSALFILYQDSTNLIKNASDFYYNNVARALNSKAYENFLLSNFEEAKKNIEDINSIKNSYPNKKTELTISKITEAKMLMRLRISWDAEKLLKSGSVHKHCDDTICRWAQGQFYITKLFLNCFYRDGKYQYFELKKTLSEIEKNDVFQRLMVDETQTYSLYYALMESYRILSRVSEFYQNEEEKNVIYLKKSISYLKKSFELMVENERVSKYDLANNFQTLAGTVNDFRKTADTTFIIEDLNRIMLILNDNKEKFGIDYNIPDNFCDIDFVMNMLLHADRLFHEMENPYQIIASKSMVADFYIKNGFNEKARPFLLNALNFMDSIDKAERQDLPSRYKFRNTTSKMAERLYNGLIKTQASQNPEVLLRWYSLYQSEIHKAFEKEKYDFNYMEISNVEKENEKKMIYLILSLILLFVISAILFIFFNYAHRNNKLLKRQKELDLERIANVETCLSIFRHDMSPFINFLQRENLPEEIRRDALNKLIVTLKNTMRWINLSTPNGLPFKKTNFVLNEVFEAVTKGITEPNEKVKLFFSPAPCCVCGDKILIEILLRNLINNALQHTTEGYVRIYAEKYEHNEDFVKITVEDTGCGIPPEQLDELFRSDKFIESENSAVTGHHGFGLMLCAYIIKKHDDETKRGCKIWVESEVGKGT